MWKTELGVGAGEGVGRKEAIQAIALSPQEMMTKVWVMKMEGSGKTEVQFRGRYILEVGPTSIIWLSDSRKVHERASHTGSQRQE